MTKFVLAQGRRFWVLTDFTLSITFFYAFATLSPTGNAVSSLELFVSTLGFATCFQLLGIGIGLYERAHRFNPWSIVRLGFIATSVALILALSLIYFLLYWKVGRYPLIFGSLGVYLTLVTYRCSLAYILGKRAYRFVILGKLSTISPKIREVCGPKQNFARFEYAEDFERWFTKNPTADARVLAEAMKNYQLQAIVLTEGATQDEHVLSLAVRALQMGVRIVDEFVFYGELFECFPIQAMTENWFLFSDFKLSGTLGQLIKRGFDICLAFALLIFLSPLLFLIALAIRLSGAGPVLFIQERQGRYGRPFHILKFRTMAVDQQENHSPSTRIQDPRITSLGKLLRPLHLDELPQLWNILLGEMSFVGPRPEVYSFVQRIRQEIPLYEFRCLARPGLTGLSQIRVGYTGDNKEETFIKLSYDLYYLKHYSLFFDFLIMVRTVFVLSKGAR